MMAKLSENLSPQRGDPIRDPGDSRPSPFGTEQLGDVDIDDAQAAAAAALVRRYLPEGRHRDEVMAALFAAPYRTPLGHGQRTHDSVVAYDERERERDAARQPRHLAATGPSPEAVAYRVRIRDWAGRNGLAVIPRGSIAEELVDRYAAATGDHGGAR